MNIKPKTSAVFALSVILYLLVNNASAHTITKFTFDMTINDMSVLGPEGTYNDLWVEFLYDEIGTVAHSYDHTTDPPMEKEYRLDDYPPGFYNFLSDAIVSFDSTLSFLLSLATTEGFDSTNSLVSDSDFLGMALSITERKWRIFAMIGPGSSHLYMNRWYLNESGEEWADWINVENIRIIHSPAPIPEPASVLLLGLGLIGLAGTKRKKQDY